MDFGTGAKARAKADSQPEEKDGAHIRPRDQARAMQKRLATKEKERGSKERERPKDHVGAVERKDTYSAIAPRSRWYGTKRNGYMKWYPLRRRRRLIKIRRRTLRKNEKKKRRT